MKGTWRARGQSPGGGARVYRVFHYGNLIGRSTDLRARRGISNF